MRRLRVPGLPIPTGSRAEPLRPHARRAPASRLESSAGWPVTQLPLTRFLRNDSNRLFPGGVPPTEEPCGHAGDDGKRLYIVRHHGASADDRAAADGDAWKN